MVIGCEPRLVMQNVMSPGLCELEYSRQIWHRRELNVAQ